MSRLYRFSEVTFESWNNALVKAQNATTFYQFKEAYFTLSG